MGVERNKLGLNPFLILTVVSLFSLSSVLPLSLAVDPVPDQFSKLQISDVQSEGAMDPPLGRPSFARAVEGAHGVVLQSRARFIFGGKEISPRELHLSWSKVTDGSSQLTLSSGGKSMIVAFNEEDTFRLAYWVAKSDCPVAFTLLNAEQDAGNPWLKKLNNKGYESPKHGFYFADYDELSRTMVKQDAVAGLIRDLLVPPALDTPGLVQALGYADFADSNQKKPDTDDVVTGVENEDRILAALKSPTPGQNASVTDETYTNSDLDSGFTVNLDNLGIEGLPLRYFWTSYDDSSLVFRSVKLFRDPDGLTPAFRVGFKDAQWASVRMFAVGAILRSFQLDDPQQLVDFINDEIDRRAAVAKP